MINEDESESFMTPEVVCPYCLYEYSDSWEFSEHEKDIECPECNNKFDIERNIETTTTYTTFRRNMENPINLSISCHHEGDGLIHKKFDIPMYIVIGHDGCDMHIEKCFTNCQMALDFKIKLDSESNADSFYVFNLIECELIIKLEDLRVIE